MSSDEKSSPDGSATLRTSFDRRSFLRVLGAAFSTAILPEMVSSCAEDGGEQFSAQDTESLTVSSSVSVIRPSDLLILTIGFVNLKHNSTTGLLVRLSSAAPSQIILDFPPQAIIEDAVTFQAGTTPTTDSIPSTFSHPTLGVAVTSSPLANSMLGGPSRLVFQLPDAYTPVPYSLSEILSLCGSSSLVLSTTMQNTLAIAVPAASGATNGDLLVDRMLATALAADDPAASGLTAALNGQLPLLAKLTAFPGTGIAPTTTTGPEAPEPRGMSDNSVTQIEIPYRLKLSPNCMAGWSHATTPVAHALSANQTAYEVWHTTLGVRSVAANLAGTVDERNAYLRTARALWTRDWDLGGVPDTVPIEYPSLTAANREDIVFNSSSAMGAAPIQVNRLMLSSLGGYLDARGDWPSAPYANRWIHKMAGGRDNFVEVDTPGFLLPFGNSATSQQITRRNDNPQIGPVGELYSYNLVIIGNPVTTYRSAGRPASTQKTLLQWPFLGVELKKTHFITRRITAGGTCWPVDAAGNPIWVPAIGYDRRGRAINFSVPLIFVPEGTAALTALTAYYGLIASVASTPAGASHVSLNVAMGGQRIAYADSKTATTPGASAPPTAPPKDDTSFATRTLSLDPLWISDGDYFQQPTTQTPQFAPVVTSAAIYVEALHSYLPNQADGTTPSINVSYHRQFTSAPAFDSVNNKSQLLFQLAAPITADFTRDPSGGDRSDGGTGFIAPNMTFTALSRTTGPAYDGAMGGNTSLGTPTFPQTVSTGPGPAQTPLSSPPALPPFADGAFDPSTYFGMASTALSNIMIFGVFSILDIINTVEPGKAASDLDGLTNLAEEAALKYAPKFIAQGLSDLEQIASLIAEVKSQVELLYTNAQELAGVVGAGLPTLALQGVPAAAQASAVAAQVALVVGAARKFYGSDLGGSGSPVSPPSGLLETIALIGAMDVETLTSAATVGGSILELINNANELTGQINNLTGMGARATVPTQATAANGYTATLGQGPALAAQTVNAALQIAAGVQQSFTTKLQDLTTALQGADLATLFQAAQQALDAARNMTVKIEWQPKVGSFALPGTSWTIFRPATQHALTLLMEVRAKATPTQSAGVDLSCRLDHFDICIGQTSDGNNGFTGVVNLQFDHISFEMVAGAKPDVDVKINGLAFGGPLAFLQSLQELIPKDGFSDPPFLNVTTDGIQAGFTLSIPNLAVGMFTLENVSITAELDIPFFSNGSVGAALTFTFSFCDKDHPFIITVSLLGGGGYLIVSFTPKGLEHLEASICVAAQLAVNIIDVAQGSVTVTAGITFTIDDSSGTDDVSLTAFLRVQGEVDLLGVITVSVSLDVSMSYDFQNRMIVGEADLQVDVTVVFFTIPVNIPFRKEFHACNNDPTLRQLMPPTVTQTSNNAPGVSWAEYCYAYA